MLSADKAPALIRREQLHRDFQLKTQTYHQRLLADQPRYTQASCMIPLTLFLGFLQAGMFAGFIYYYSASAQWVTVRSSKFSHGPSA